MANEEVLELQIRDNAADAAAGLLSLSSALERVKEAVGKGLRLKGTATQLETLKNAVNSGLNEESVARFERLASVLERLKGIGALKIAGIKNIASQMNVADSLNEAKEQASAAAEGIAGAVDRGLEEVESRSVNVGNSLSEAFSNARDKASALWTQFKGVIAQSREQPGGFLKELADGAAKGMEGMRGLLDDFKRIVKYRMIRSIIKQITEAFTTGIKNVYGYSKAIGSSFAPAMDDAASILLQFKNSIGAAVAPLIQQLLPVLKAVVNAAIEAFNYLNMFLALLRGQNTWTKALYKPVEAFEETKKKAKGASKALKDLLADWDELNIIQSESGGGGGGAAQAAEDYTKMFEEESKFDDFLYNHYKDLLEYIKLAGVALAGWKLSKSFTGFMNKLFRFVAGGALVSLGVKLSFDAGYDAGFEGFNGSNIARALLGSLAAAVGGYLVAGSMGLGIGLAVSVYAFWTGYVEGKADITDKNKWGNLTWTQEQIEKFVLSQFTFDVRSDITVLDGEIANRREALNNLNKKIADFKNALDDANIQAEIKIDSAETSDAVIKAADAGKEAIKAVNKLVNDSDAGLNVILKSFSFTNEAGEDISKELLSSVNISNQTVTDYFTGIGDELAALIEKGEHEHWKNADTTQAVLDLLERERKILAEASQYTEELTLDTKIRSGFNSVIDRDTARAALEQQKAELKSYQDTAMELFSAQAAEYDKLAGIAMSSAKDAREQNDIGRAEELEAAAENYHAMALSILNDAQSKIDAKLSETRANMASEWAKTLQVVYGEDFEKDFNNAEFGVRLKDKLGSLKNVRAAGFNLREWIEKMLINDDPNGIVSYVLNDLNGNVFDLLSEDMKQQLWNTMMKTFKNDADGVKEVFKEAFSLTDKDIDDLLHIEPLSEEDLEILEDVDLDANATIHLETDAEAFRQQLKDELEYAIWDGVLTADEEEALRRRFSDALYEEMLDNLDIQTDKFGNVQGRLGARQLASTGYYVGGAGAVATPITTGTGNEPQEEPITQDDIASGVRKGNDDLNASLNEISSKLTALGNKSWTVNVYPSSGWGFQNRQTDRILDKIIG